MYFNLTHVDTFPVGYIMKGRGSVAQYAEDIAEVSELVFSILSFLFRNMMLKVLLLSR